MAPDRIATESAGRSRVAVVLPEGAEAPAEFLVTRKTVTDKMASVEFDRVPFDRENRILVLDLPEGRTFLGSEAPGLRGDLPPFDVTEEGARVKLSVTLKVCEAASGSDSLTGPGRASFGVA